MTRISDLHKAWLKDSNYRKAYDALHEEFALAREAVRAAKKAARRESRIRARLHGLSKNLLGDENASGHDLGRAARLKKHEGF